MTGDMASALTGSLPVDGSAPMTGPIKAASGSVSAPGITFSAATNSGWYKTTNGWGLSIGGTLITEATASGLLNGSGAAYQTAATVAWTDVASASTTNIGAAGSSNVRITGTTTITAFDTVASGTTVNIRFAAALTLTYNATSLILPSAANITTAANDTATAVSLGSGNWIVIDYMRANGTPLVTGLPSQTSNSGKVLTTDGTTASWGTAANSLVWGYFDARTGSVTASNLKGCTVARNSVGNYTITFSSAFTGIPGVSVTSTQPRDELLSLSNSAWNFRTLDASGTLTDTLCSFIVVGV